jgi:hypothetical protein
MARVLEDPRGWLIECPACKIAHLFDKRWIFNGNRDLPSFTPSMLAKTHLQHKKFPVLRGGHKKTIPEALDYVPWPMLQPHEKHAEKNHQQTLQVLASRGGLSPQEIVAIMKGSSWEEMKTIGCEEAERTIIEMTEHWYDNRPLDVCHSFVTDGKIQYLSDCTHAMAGQTVDLLEI